MIVWKWRIPILLEAYFWLIVVSCFFIVLTGAPAEVLAEVLESVHLTHSQRILSYAVGMCIRSFWFGGQVLEEMVASHSLLGCLLCPAM